MIDTILETFRAKLGSDFVPTAYANRRGALGPNSSRIGFRENRTQPRRPENRRNDPVPVDV
jgi:hypothetical protein